MRGIARSGKVPISEKPGNRPRNMFPIAGVVVVAHGKKNQKITINSDQATDL